MARREVSLGLWGQGQGWPILPEGSKGSAGEEGTWKCLEDEQVGAHHVQLGQGGAEEVRATW